MRRNPACAGGDFYVEVQSMNALPGSTKVWLSILSFSLLVMILGYHFGGRSGLLLGFLLTVGFQALIYYFGDSQLLEFFNAQKVEGQDAWGLHSQIRRHSMLLQLPKPDFYLVESQAPFAFSLGHSWERGSICISTGLLNRLSSAEVEAIVAHQVCHIHRLNSYGFGLAHVLAFSLVGLGRLLDKISPARIFFKKNRPFFSQLLSPLAWLVLRLAVNDQIFFQNDEMAVALLKDSRFLAEALWKLESLSQTHPLALPPCSSHFFVVNPTKITERTRLLFAHPQIDIRIKKLIGYFPI